MSKPEELPVMLYTTHEGAVKGNAVLKDESLWLMQLAMTQLFEVDKSSIVNAFRCIHDRQAENSGVNTDIYVIGSSVVMATHEVVNNERFWCLNKNLTLARTSHGRINGTERT